MAYRVAVATNDGIHVDSHFGHVSEFEIIEVDEKTGAFEEIEYRRSLPACGGGECGGKSEADLMDRIAAGLQDVSYLLAVRTGLPAVKALARYNIRALDVALPIDQAVQKIQSFRNIQKKYRNRKAAG